RVVLVAQTEIHGQLRRHGPLVLDEGEEPPEADAGISDLQIALHEGGDVEQERREAVRKTGRRRGIARDRRLLGPELKLSARPAVVLRLQEEVARVAKI